MELPLQMVRDCCPVCKRTDKLLRCSACGAVHYCGRDHQVAHRNTHKAACNGIKAALQNLKREETKMRNELEAPYEECVGHFWGIYETRGYMRARYGVVEALGKVKTHEAAQKSCEHMREMLTLCRGDNMGIRDVLPAQYLRVGRDQDCYDFVKWWQEVSDDYDWSDLDLPYLDIKDASVFESADIFTRDKYPKLSPLVALVLIKYRLIYDLRSLHYVNKIKALTDILPPELIEYLRRNFLARSIVTQDRDVITSTDLCPLIQALGKQIEQLYAQVDKANKHFWPALLSPAAHLNKRPNGYSMGSIEEMRISLQYHYDSWSETPGAIAMIRWLRRRN